MVRGKTLGLGEQWAKEFSAWLGNSQYMAERNLGGYRSEIHGNALEFSLMDVRTRLEFHDPEGNGRKLHLHLQMSLEIEGNKKELVCEYTRDLGEEPPSRFLGSSTVDLIIDDFLLPGLKNFIENICFPKLLKQ